MKKVLLVATMVLVACAFMVQDALAVLDIFDIFADAGANQMILEPSVRPFDFALRLW